MFDIVTTLFESLVSFLETLISYVNFVITNIASLFQVFDYVPPILKAPCILALSIIVVLGVKKAVLA